MREDFKIFLRNIRPTNKGVFSIMIMLVIIPAIADVIFFFSIKNKELFSVTYFMIVHCLQYIPLLLVYLVVFFIISYWFKKIFHKKW